ncbi:hypothetical protein [Planomonospora sphaerica]|uniref:hypothetical protein n=1 Tax=Planomonospora sphaerica TaxID=161355 RepID=UPI0012907661|nr:hypothetical protein [Planomonospora sphaerica]
MTATDGAGGFYTRPIAVDEDGSTLVETTQYDVAIWRGGVVTPLETPPGVQYPQGVDLSNERAVGGRRGRRGPAAPRPGRYGA